MDYSKLSNHIKQKFDTKEKIIKLKNVPNDDKLEELVDNRVYSVGFTCLAVDIIDSSKMNEIYGIENTSKIISEFAWGISTIMNEFNGKWVTIQGDGIYCIFNAGIRDEIDNVLNCAATISTYKEMLNKIIKNKLNFFNDELDYGIGIWYSSENLITKVGKKGNREIVFLGDSVNYANFLSKKSSRTIKSNHQAFSGFGFSNDIFYNSILMNDLFYQNLTEEFKYHESITFNKLTIDKFIIYGSDLFIVPFKNFIENNI
ncbi:MAG: hypothetical protein ACRC4L_01620 [Mycoplasma sp.]